MKWKDAVKEARRMRCPEAIAVVVKPLSQKKPDPNQDAGVQCKEKVRRGIMPDDCDSNCPLGKR